MPGSKSAYVKNATFPAISAGALVNRDECPQMAPFETSID
jgi:hypothetical protein